jgi:ectoine hydroxylase
MNDEEKFLNHGFVLKKKLFNEEEINKLDRLIQQRKEKEASTNNIQTSSGKLSMNLWNKVSDDLFGRFSTNERIVNPMQEFLKDEIYHYHSKIIFKKPGDGGFDWHQDYGYWYNNACLYPDMGSCFIMIDQANKANGCLKVLQGSHKVGRISHDNRKTGEETADIERILELEKRHETVYIEADRGDTLFFHSNLLHSSAANKSDYSRRTLIICFNTKTNNPYKEIAHSSYEPLIKSSYNSILEY